MWTAPPVHRRPEPLLGDERAMLEQWLDYHRDTLLIKCSGLTGAQLAERAAPPSTLSLLGLVRHLADVERSWFRRRFAGADAPPIFYSDADPDGDLQGGTSDEAPAYFVALAAEVAAARAAVVGRSLDEEFTDVRDGSVRNLRWIYVHMIEEYARHNGHADLLRERIDGATGD